MTDHEKSHRTIRTGVRDRIAERYRAALERLRNGSASHPEHAGRSIKISAATVAREAGLSRNPLYTTHRVILAEIAKALDRPALSDVLSEKITVLTAQVQTLKLAARDHASQKRALATENLSLLHRARAAEDRIAGLEREIGALRQKDAEKHERR